MKAPATLIDSHLCHGTFLPGASAQLCTLKESFITFVSPHRKGLLNCPLPILLAPSGQEVGEDLVRVGMPGTPKKARLHDLLKLLRKLPEELELLHYMEGTIEPVIFSLKFIFLPQLIQFNLQGRGGRQEARLRG